jgi:hypothetical protein
MFTGRDDAPIFFNPSPAVPSRRILEPSLSGKPGDAPAQNFVVVATGGALPAGQREGRHRSEEGVQHWSQAARCAWLLARDLAPAPLQRERSAASTGEQAHRPRVAPREDARRISCEKRLKGISWIGRRLSVPDSCAAKMMSAQSAE